MPTACQIPSGDTFFTHFSSFGARSTGAQDPGGPGARANRPLQDQPSPRSSLAPSKFSVDSSGGSQAVVGRSTGCVGSCWSTSGDPPWLPPTMYKSQLQSGPLAASRSQRLAQTPKVSGLGLKGEPGWQAPTVPHGQQRAQWALGEHHLLPSLQVVATDRVESGQVRTF